MQTEKINKISDEIIRIKERIEKVKGLCSGNWFKITDNQTSFVVEENSIDSDLLRVILNRGIDNMNKQIHKLEENLRLLVNDNETSS